MGVHDLSVRNEFGQAICGAVGVPHDLCRKVTVVDEVGHVPVVTVELFGESDLIVKAAEHLPAETVVRGRGLCFKHTWARLAEENVGGTTNAVRRTRRKRDGVLEVIIEADASRAVAAFEEVTRSQQRLSDAMRAARA